MGIKGYHRIISLSLIQNHTTLILSLFNSNKEFEENYLLHINQLNQKKVMIQFYIHLMKFKKKKKLTSPFHSQTNYIVKNIIRVFKVKILPSKIV
jgi:hypothetical protein